MIHCKDYTPDQVYFLMIQAIIPRPIAWVLSDNGDSTYNLAPFSFFNGVAAEPPLLMISVGYKDDGSRKDTWVNIEERDDFVVHIPPTEFAHQMVDSAISLPHGKSELDRLDMKLETVEGSRLPRLAGPRVAMFCEKYAIYEVGDDKQGLILGEIKQIWLDDAAAHIQGKRIVVDPVMVDPVARLGGSGYSKIGEILNYKRPEAK